MVDRSAMHGRLLVVDDFTDGTPCQVRFGAIGFLLQKLKHIHRKANGLFMQCFLQLQRMHMIQLLSTWDHTEEKNLSANDQFYPNRRGLVIWWLISCPNRRNILENAWLTLLCLIYLPNWYRNLISLMTLSDFFSLFSNFTIRKDDFSSVTHR